MLIFCHTLLHNLLCSNVQQAVHKKMPGKLSEIILQGDAV